MYDIGYEKDKMEINNYPLSPNKEYGTNVDKKCKNRSFLRKKFLLHSSFFLVL